VRRCGLLNPEARLIMRGRYNRTDRYPSIVEAARKNRVKQFVIKGEAVVHRRRRRRRFHAGAMTTRSNSAFRAKLGCGRSRQVLSRLRVQEATSEGQRVRDK